MNSYGTLELKKIVDITIKPFSIRYIYRKLNNIIAFQFSF